MRRGEFKENRFVLCEGFEDSAITRGLIATASRHIPPYDVSPNHDLGTVPGNSGFEEAILGSAATRGFADVEDVVIVADNDDNPNAAFKNICDQITRAKQDGLSRNWAIPKQPGVKEAGDPSVTVWMWPSAGNRGCLETVLWQLIQAKYPVEAACVSAAIKCSGANSWPISKLDKARVRCFISLVCKRNPALALGLVWRDQPQLFPLTSAVFTSFARFLASI